MRGPDCKFAACDCELDRQRQICHHQVAYLLQQNYNQRAAEKRPFKMLGLVSASLGNAPKTTSA